MNSSSGWGGWDVAGAIGSTGRAEQPGAATTFENASERNDAIHLFNLIDGTGEYNPDDVKEFAVQRTQFDRQSHSYHKMILRLNNLWFCSLALNIDRPRLRSISASFCSFIDFWTHSSLSLPAFRSTPFSKMFCWKWLFMWKSSLYVQFICFAPLWYKIPRFGCACSRSALPRWTWNFIKTEPI